LQNLLPRNAKEWPELIPKIESWLNTTIPGSTGFTPVELMFNDNHHDLFSKILNKTKEQKPSDEDLQDKISLAYLTMKKKPQKEKGGDRIYRREPELSEEVLLNGQPNSDAALVITAKFMRPFDGPWVITKMISPSCYEVSDKEAKIR
jgi:hypothetical protein